ncbi:conserved exported hypothetical protein [Capnocytophaga canis]|nr:conserved exported hypothetical protein [Capnocytophaga canis]
MMKKNILITALSLAALCSCNKTTTPKTETPQTALENVPQPFISSIEYSNLVDKASQEEVKKALSAAGIKEENIQTFLDNVSTFNQTVGEVGMVKEGFATSQNLTPEYDKVKIQEKWEEKNPVFAGYNCRITSFDMLRDFVRIENPILENAKNLFVDEDALENNPKKVFSNKERDLFMAFFSQIPTVEGKDISKHIDMVQKDWQKKGISFIHNNDKTKASLISVFFHSFFSKEDNHLFIGHIGVLVPSENGKLIFIEKLSFQEPYQVLKFNNRTELNDYLMNRYDVEWNQPTAAPFIFENNQLIEGYRPNPNKKIEQSS